MIEELAEIKSELAKINNDPDVMFLECHCFEIENIKTIGRKAEQCKKCPAYISFASQYPKHFPNYY